MKKPTVLIVDDNDDFRTIWDLKLKNSNFKVLTSKNGRGALEILKNNNVDIILLDILMPEMNGIETFLEIKRDPKMKNTKVFFITSLDDNNPNPEIKNYHDKIAKELGAVKYLKKSTDLEELTDILKKEADGS